jgi:hypothetical protein
VPPGVPGPVGEVGVAVHGRDDVGQLGAELALDPRVVGVAGGEEAVLRDPRAVDDVDGRGWMREVVRAQLLVEAGRKDRVDTQRAGAQRRHLRQPAAVVRAGLGPLAGEVPGNRRAEIHSRPEPRLEALAGGGELEVLAVDAPRELQPADARRRPAVVGGEVRRVWGLGGVSAAGQGGRQRDDEQPEAADCR